MVQRAPSERWTHRESPRRPNSWTTPHGRIAPEVKYSERAKYGTRPERFRRKTIEMKKISGQWWLQPLQEAEIRLWLWLYFY